MPKMFLLATIGSSALVGAALAHLAARLPTSTGPSHGRSAVVDRTRSIYAAVRDAAETGIWWKRRAAPSASSAFEDYRAEALARLEVEHRQFREFLKRLRQASDKTEFDAFMADRGSRPDSPKGTMGSAGVGSASSA